jgi:sirohydrochlorin cobaltochelatase
MVESRTLILLAHGSRAAEARDEIKSLAAELANPRPGLTVKGAFLSLLEPDLPTAFAEAVAEGASRVQVLPLFLFSGRHMLEDVPALVESLRAGHPEIQVDLLQPIGRHPDFAEFLLKAASIG